MNFLITTYLTSATTLISHDYHSFRLSMKTGITLANYHDLKLD